MIGIEGSGPAARGAPFLSLRVPARADYLASVRAAVQPYTREVAGDADVAFVATLAVDEACTDLIERTHQGSGSLLVEAARDAETMRFVVTLDARAADAKGSGVRAEMIRTISTRASFLRTTRGEERIEIDFELARAGARPAAPAAEPDRILAELYDLEEFRLRRAR